MKKTGVFYNNEWANKWWDVSTTISGITSADLGLYRDNTRFFNGATITSSVPSLQADYYKIAYTSSIALTSGSDYEIELKLYGSASQKISYEESSSQYTTQSSADIEIYMSGSSFDHYVDQGRLLKKLSTSTAMNYGTISASFIPDATGTGTPIIKINAGKWHIADMSVKVSQAPGFSPNEYTFYTSLPTWARDDDLDFKFEFYDVDNNRGPDVIYSKNNKFSGSNVYIQGDDNITTGSMYLGNALYAGIEWSGKDSAYMRSIGYDGWISASYSSSDGSKSGFMIWSGSVLPILQGETSPEVGQDPNNYATYSGIGLELHDGLDIGSSSYLRFRTDPSLLELVTDTFYFGRSGSMYISGSGGIIEISSSNFFLSSSGDLIISGTIYAETGSIGGWIIDSGSIYKNRTHISSDSSSFIVYNEDETYPIILVGDQSLSATSSRVQLPNDSFENGSGYTTESWSMEFTTISQSDAGEGSSGSHAIKFTPQASLTDCIYKMATSKSVSISTDDIVNISFYAKRFSTGSAYKFNQGMELYYYHNSAWEKADIVSSGSYDANYGNLFGLGSDWAKKSNQFILKADTTDIRIAVTGSIYSYGTVGLASMYDQFDVSYGKPKVELTKDGLVIYQSEDSYIKLTTSSFDINIQNVNIRELSVDNLNVDGALFIDGDITQTGSFEITGGDVTARGNISASVVSASTYYGDGSNLTNVPSTGDSDWQIEADHLSSSVEIRVIGRISASSDIHATGSLQVGNDITASGDYSTALGTLTSASAEFSHAEGSGSKATGTGSHAEGVKTQATGKASHAEGQNASAAGTASHAEGASTANENFSHAEGVSTADGVYSHAEGGGWARKIYSHAEATSQANGDYSHAEGDADTHGDYSHGEGYACEAYGIYSHVEGNQSKTKGSSSHAEGSKSLASGTASHAEGQRATSSGDFSHAQNRWTIAKGYSQTTIGAFNIEQGTSDGSSSTDNVFIIGNGGNDGARRNALTVKWSGDTWISGSLSIEDGELFIGTASHALNAGSCSSFSGTDNYLAVFTSSGTSITDSIISQSNNIVYIKASGSNAGLQIDTDIPIWGSAVRAVNTNMSAGDIILYSIGQEDSAKNLGYFGFQYQGDGVDTNAIRIGFHSEDYILNIFADRTIELTGSTYINGSVTTNEYFRAISNNSDTWFWSFGGLNSGMGVNDHNEFVVGKEASALNAFEMGFRYAGDGDTENCIFFGLYGAADESMKLFGDKRLELSGSLYVSGGISSSGDLSVSGSIRGRELYYTHHACEVLSGNGSFYLPLNSTSSYGTGSINSQINQWIAPYSGSLLKVILRCEESMSSTFVEVEKGADGAQNPNTSIGTQTVDIVNASSSYTFTFTNANFSSGDVLAVSIDPTRGSEANLNATCIWEYYTNE